MVHIDRSLGPIGAWGYTDDGLTHFYPESLDVEISARGRDDMSARNLELSVPEWFCLLASREPTLDEYVAFQIDGEEPISLITVLAEYRRQWNEHAQH